MIKKFKIGDKIIGKKIFIIAEMACAHGGKFNYAKKIIDAAARSNADAIQFEVYEPDLTCIPGTSENKELRQVYFDKKQWLSLFSYAKRKKLKVFSFCYDLDALIFSIKSKVDCIKVNSSDLLNIDFLDTLVKTKIPFTLGTGSSKLEEIKFSINYLKKRNKHNFIIMHGVQNFPTKILNERINKVSFIEKKFKNFVGYANHTAGNLDEAKFIDLIAIGAGAKVLEKHIIINRKDKHFDYFSSLEPKEFKNYVSFMRKGQSAFDTYNGFEITKSDIKYRIFQKKSIVLSKDVKKGDKLSRENICFIRNMTEEGIAPNKYKKVKKKYFKKNFKKFSVLKYSMLK